MVSVITNYEHKHMKQMQEWSVMRVQNNNDDRRPLHQNNNECISPQIPILSRIIVFHFLVISWNLILYQIMAAYCSIVTAFGYAAEWVWNNMLELLRKRTLNRGLYISGPPSMNNLLGMNQN